MTVYHIYMHIEMKTCTKVSPKANVCNLHIDGVRIPFDSLYIIRQHLDVSTAMLQREILARVI